MRPTLYKAHTLHHDATITAATANTILTIAKILMDQAVDDSTNPPLDVEEGANKTFEYSTRAQCLRAAILGANDGLVSISSIMIGVGAVKSAADARNMMIAGVAGLVAGACSMAIGEYVSVHAQLGTEMAHLNEMAMASENVKADDEVRVTLSGTQRLWRSLKAAGASAAAFAVGGIVPLMAAQIVEEYKVRIGVVVGAVSIALLVFGWLGAVLGRVPDVWCSVVRVVVGGWITMAITYGSMWLASLLLKP